MSKRERGRRVVRFLVTAALAAILFGLQTAAKARPPGWMSPAEVLAAAESSGRPVLVFFGRDGCRFSPPALAAFDDASVRRAVGDRVPLAYADMDEADGQAFASRVHVDSTPLGLFLDAKGSEIWRAVLTDKPAETVALVNGVLEGRLTWDEQRRRMREGTLSPGEALNLAKMLLKRGETTESFALIAKIVADPSKYPASVRQQASLLRADEGTNEERVVTLREHLAAFPEDLSGRIELSLVLFQTKAPAEQLSREAARLSYEMRLREAEHSAYVVQMGYQIPLLVTLYRDPATAGWVLPYALRKLELDPRDRDTFVSLVAVAVLAKDEGAISRAKSLVQAASGGMAPSKIKDAEDAGRKWAAEIQDPKLVTPS